MLADMVLAKLEEGTQQWTAGWLTSRPPQSAVARKPRLLVFGHAV